VSYFPKTRLDKGTGMAPVNNTPITNIFIVVTAIPTDNKDYNPIHDSTIAIMHNTNQNLF